MIDQLDLTQQPKSEYRCLPLPHEERFYRDAYNAGVQAAMDLQLLRPPSYANPSLRQCWINGWSDRARHIPELKEAVNTYDRSIHDE